MIFAIPDPHIERWYLMDQRAFKLGVGLPSGFLAPSYKCKRDYYKSLMGQALAQGGISSLFGGTEFGQFIVDQMVDLDALFHFDVGFQRFIEDLRRFFRPQVIE